MSEIIGDTNARRAAWLALWFLATLTSSRSGFAEEPSDSPPQGSSTLTEYSVKKSWERAGGEDDAIAGKHTFTIKTYDLSRPKKEREIIAVVQGDLEESHNLPVGALVIEASGKPRVTFEHPMGRILSTALVPVLRPEIPKERIASPGSGDAEVELDKPSVTNVPVGFAATEHAAGDDGSEARIAYLASLKGGPFVSQSGTTTTKITALEHRIEFAKCDYRVLKGKWSCKYERTYGGTTRTRTEDLEVTEIARRELSSEEVAKVSEQYEKLSVFNDALLPGTDQMLRETKAGAKLKKALEAFKKDYSGELLAEAVLDLESALGKVFTKLDLPKHPEDRAKLMLGRKAPDFSLKDLAGKEVKLSDYQGQVVLICFWAYL